MLMCGSGEFIRKIFKGICYCVVLVSLLEKYKGICYYVVLVSFIRKM